MENTNLTLEPESENIDTVKKRFCSNCGQELPQNVSFCNACGNAVDAAQPTPAPQAIPQPQNNIDTKFCKHCGQKIPAKAVICTLCGCQVEEIAPQQQPTIHITNSNDSINTNSNINNNMMAMGKPKNKWVTFVLALFFGAFGVHKFYEGKIGMGILYILTVGLFGIGIFVDLIVALCRSNPYYV